MKNTFPTFLFLFFLTNYITAQLGDLPHNAEAGKCYAKCLIGSGYEIYEEEFPIYIGDEPETVDLDTIELVLQPAGTKWEKRKAKNSFLSQNPNQESVWCLVEVPEEVITIVYMLEPSQSELVDWEFYEIKEVNGGVQTTEWREVLCYYDLSEAVIFQIQEALRNEGYQPDDKIAPAFYENNKTSSKAKEKLGLVTKAALTKFQKENGLPVGHLDFETLEALGILW